MAADSLRLSPRNPRARRAIAQALQTLENRRMRRQRALATEVSKPAKAHRELHAFFQQQIAESPAASRAQAELRRHRFAGTTPVVRSWPALEQDGSAVPSAFDLHLKRGLAFVGAPYDYDWEWGNHSGVIRDRIVGQMAVRGASGHIQRGTGDRVEAAAGIGIVLTTDKPAWVNVVAVIRYTYNYVVGATGLGSYGEVSGGLDAAAFLNGQIIAGVHRDELFSDSRGTLGVDRGDDADHAWPPALKLEFSMKPGQVVAVNYGAWVMADHEHWIGVGGAGATVNARVLWICIERQ